MTDEHRTNPDDPPPEDTMAATVMPSYFEDLLERINEKSRQQEAEDSSSNADDSDTRDGLSRQEEDPLERVRELFAERLPTAERSDGVQTTGEHRVHLGGGSLYAGMVVGVALALLIPGITVATLTPIPEIVFDRSPGADIEAGETLYLNENDAAYLSRVYEETTHEVAYCGLITSEGGRPILEIWMADTVRAAPDQIEYFTDNCPASTQEVLLHTHPNGALELSNQDKFTLMERAERIMCVQGGQITAEPGAEVSALACYQQPQTGDGGQFVRVPLVVQEDSVMSLG